MGNLKNDIRTFFDIFVQLNILLTKKQKCQSIRVFGFILIGAIFETIGIAAILPFISAVIEPSALWKNKYIILICNYIPIRTDAELIVFLGISISAVFIIKNIFLMYITYIESRFTSNIRYELSKLMLHSYLKRPYTYFLDTNSAKMIRGINGDVSSVVEIIGCLYKIASLLLMVSGIGIFLIIQDVRLAIGVISLAIVIVLLYVLAIKKKAKQLGVIKRELDAESYQYAYQAINGYKEISIMKRQEYFLQSYTNVTSKTRKIDVLYACIMASPDRIVEAVFLTGIMSLVCWDVVSGSLSSAFISNLAVFAVAAVRILPSLATLSSRVTHLVYLRPALKGISENIKAARDYTDGILQRETNVLEKVCNISDKWVMNISHITWKYPNSSQYILEDASAKICCGDAVALVGKSGAGKTTLADIILGLLEPEKGNVYIDNASIFSIPKIWCKMVGYVPQTVYLVDDTIYHNVAFGIQEEEIDIKKIWAALERAQLRTFVECLPEKLNTIVGEHGVKFSGGQRQRIAIARALYYDPQIIIFDEATAALDTETEQAVMEAIEELHGSKTLIIIAHRLNTIKHCNHIFAVENRKIVEKQYGEICGKEIIDDVE